MSDVDTDGDDIIWEYESEELHTPVSSEDEGNKHQWPEFNDQYSFGEGRFELGTRFVGCKDEECGWIAHLSYNRQLQCFQIKTYRNEHTCARDLGSNAADQHWISKKVEKRMSTHPHMTTHEAVDFLREDFDLTTYPKMVYRAVKEARERMMGNEKQQYGKLRDYLLEIHRSNPGSSALLDLIPQPQAPPMFDKLYVCFEAFARSENKESWKWFLTLLQEDIGDGLLPALKEVMPSAHVRNCVMHMWKNFINRFKDLYIREIVWDCARCTIISEFKTTMERLKEVNMDAWAYLMKFDPATWVRAYFSHGPKVDNLTNNMCESFNAKVVKYRCKPILTMCKELRCYVMQRMVQHKKLLGTHEGKLAPVQEKRLQRLIKPSNKWTAEWIGDNERKRFELTYKGSKVDVDLIKHSCSCNKWQLTGIPCIHSIAAIKKRHDNPDDYVHPWLCMESIRKTYEHFIQPVTSEEYWTRSEFTKPAPPVLKRPIGRPKVHNRQKDPAEAVIDGDKLKRSFYVTCSKCGERGHNYKTCKGAPSNPN
ncbi:uncharacterized protein LOC107493000 [Arachis duranensis]|uniref:Uncharacterized protein LOC107493000 n=1 Tax=Arachis duranensis TaxID=130453 RepID=A0A9C6WWP9_ARADU|nr:uncharacterized protein LOC107493000 [Arachis duranensis]